MSIQEHALGGKGRIFVTGGTGFLGSYIIKELVQKNYPVRALRRVGSKIPFYIPSAIFEKVEWVEGDVLDIVSMEDAMEGVDAVIHAAATISFLRKQKQQMYQVNFQGTINAVNAALEKNVKRFVHISSVAALGRVQTGAHVNEEKKWQDTKVNTQYGITKYRAEMEVWRAIGEGLNAVIVNPSTVLGFGDWNTTSCRLFKTVYQEFPWYSTGINGFVDVEDVARATVLLMEHDISEKRFIVSGENWSFEKLFNHIADAFGKKRPYRKSSPFLAAIAWRLEYLKSIVNGKAPLLTKESARVAQSSTFFENDKILKELPEFSFTPLEKSIREACEKYLDAIKTGKT